MRVKSLVMRNICVLTAALFWAAASSEASNVVTNSGFELGSNPSPWVAYGVNDYVLTSAARARSGANYLKVYQAFTGSVNYTGVYQDNLSGPGVVYSANGWAFTLSNDALAGQNAAWLEVSFRDASQNVIAIYRSSAITTNALKTRSFPTNAWVDLAVTNQYDPNTYALVGTANLLVAPAGTSFVRFQITFQGDAAYSGGSVYFDDMTLTQVSGEPQGNWNLVWSDEFNGTSINTSIWTYDLGNNNGWGNSELEYYTRSTQNAFVSDGLLHIRALKQSTNGFNYTSARMKTEGLYSAEYGRFEWRASLPSGTGFWPALWMLGNNITSMGWPGCGEIDVVENNGSTPTNVQGSLHSGSDETQTYTLPSGSVTNFHRYLLEWTTNAVSWFVDGIRYQTQTSWSSSVGSYPTPFNQPFFIIMNLAVGGNYVGNPSTASINANAFPAEMQVDYVRLYNLTAPLQLSAAVKSGQLSLTWPTNIVCHLEASNGLGSSSVWTIVPGAASPYSAPLLPTAAFYRLVSP